MKYLVCLVALLFLCLSPNPSFAQPNSSEVKQLKVVSDYKSEGFWAFDNYWAVLGQIDELFFNGKPRQFEQLTTEQKRELIPKYEEFVKGLIKGNPEIVEEFIHDIRLLKELREPLNKENLLNTECTKNLEMIERIVERIGKRLLDKLAKKIGLQMKMAEMNLSDDHISERLIKKFAQQRIIIDFALQTLLRALAVIIPYSSLEDKVDLDSLEPYHLEFMKRTRQTLFDLGWKHFEGESLDKFGFQLTKSESPNKRTSSPESPNKSRRSSKSPNKSRSSSKSPERSQRTISPQ